MASIRLLFLSSLSLHASGVRLRLHSGYAPTNSGTPGRAQCSGSSSTPANSASIHSPFSLRSGAGMRRRGEHPAKTVDANNFQNLDPTKASASP